LLSDTTSTAEVNATQLPIVTMTIKIANIFQNPNPLCVMRFIFVMSKEAFRQI
jgi:hypothetical protein